MSPEVWSTIAIGIAILIAIATSNRAMRRETNERIDKLSERLEAVRRELSDRIDGVQRDLGGRIDGVQHELGGRIDGVQHELGDLRSDLGGRIDGVQRDLGDVRERLGQVEGPPEGAGPKRPRRASMERGDDMQNPTPPRP